MTTYVLETTYPFTIRHRPRFFWYTYGTKVKEFDTLLEAQVWQSYYWIQYGNTNPKHRERIYRHPEYLI